MITTNIYVAYIETNGYLHSNFDNSSFWTGNRVMGMTWWQFNPTTRESDYCANEYYWTKISTTFSIWHLGISFLVYLQDSDNSITTQQGMGLATSLQGKSHRPHATLNVQQKRPCCAELVQCRQTLRPSRTPFDMKRITISDTKPPFACCL